MNALSTPHLSGTVIGNATNAGLPTVINVKDAQYGAKGDGIVDDTAALQAALNAGAGGRVVFFPPGTYKITASLTITNNTVIMGGGSDNNQPIIKPTSTTTNAITGTNIAVFKMENMYLYGPSSGSGIGLALLYSGAGPNNTNIVLRDCRIGRFGGNGLHIDTPVVTNLERVVSFLNGGHGFYLGDPSNPSGGTSVTMNSCYANNNGLAGYYFQRLQYSSLNGCAADSNGTGYYFDTCIGMSVNSCGTESNTNKGGLYTGNGFVVSGGRSIGLRNCFVYNSPATAYNYWVTNSAANIQVFGCTDSGTIPANSVRFDSGSSGSIMDSNLVGSTTYPNTVNNYPLAANTPLADDQGLKAWNFDPTSAVGSTTTALTGGVIYLMRVNLRTPQSVTNLYAYLSTAGVTLTTNQNFAGLYNSSGTLIASSADQTTLWTSTGYKTIALSGGPYSLLPGSYYIALLANGTTPPAFARGAGLNMFNGTLGSSSLRFATNGTAQTTLPASLTLSNNATGTVAYWVALS